MKCGKMKILRIITRLNIGGPSVHVASLSKAIQDTILVHGSLSPGEGDMSYLLGGRKASFIPSLQREISFDLDWEAYRKIQKIIKINKPNIIHTHTSKAGFLGRVAARNSRAVIVHTFHGNVLSKYFDPAKSHLFCFIEKFLAKNTDAIIAISEQQKDEICNKYKIAPRDKIRVIRLGFDLKPFLSIDLPSRDDLFRVGIIGRLTEVKNHKLFLKIARNFMGFPFQFYIFGDGELRYDLKREAPENVIFRGNIPYDQMPLVYQGLDVVLSTSLNEGTPVALIEAMASGRVVVSTDVGGVREMGVKYIANNADSFTDILKNLRTEGGWEKAIKYSEKNRKKIKEKYSVERMINETKNLYEELLRGRA